MASTETQWQVTWFPPDRPEVTKVGTEEEVRRTARKVAEWSPIIESREIVVGEWRTVQNLTMGIEG